MGIQAPQPPKTCTHKACCLQPSQHLAWGRCVRTAHCWPSHAQDQMESQGTHDKETSKLDIPLQWNPHLGFPESLQVLLGFLNINFSPCANLVSSPSMFHRSKLWPNKMSGNEKPNSSEAEPEKWFLSKWLAWREPLPTATQFQLLCVPFQACQAT